MKEQIKYMKGLELSRKFYEEYGLAALKEAVPEFEDIAAAGMAGAGSENFGFDDEISKDHDFQIGFRVWLTNDADEKYGFKLMRAYSKLPKEYHGMQLESKKSYNAGLKYGVSTIEEFFEQTIGRCALPESWQEWFYTPEYALCNAVNGEVFTDRPGEFSEARRILEDDMPEDVWKKKIAGRLALMAQSGQYNYERCIGHKEIAAAQLALAEFVNNACYLLCALNRTYTPFYKWRLKKIRNLTILSELESDLEYLLISDSACHEQKIECIENISRKVITELEKQQLTDSTNGYLEVQAAEVMKKINNREIAALHIMECGEQM